MPVKDVEAGMKGYGLTVYRGAEPQKFGFEVLGVKEMRLGAVTKTSVIVAKLTSGPEGFSPSHTGVVAGMSGSPMYVDGKLIGALAYSFTGFAKDPICGIQPAEYMLNPQINEAEKNGMSDLSIRYIPLVLNVPANLTKEFFKKGRDKIDFLTGNFVIQPMAAVSEGYKEINNNLRMKPGSSLAVYLVKGDIFLSATGTVTMVHGDKIYAFGHPFLGIGKTAMPFHQNEIITINTSWDDSSKMSGGEAGTVQGTISHDYHSAIFGRIGETGKTIAVKIVSNGEKNNRIINKEFAKSRFLAGLLVRFIIPNVLKNSLKEIMSSAPDARQNISFVAEFVFDGKKQPIVIELNSNFSDKHLSMDRYAFAEAMNDIISVAKNNNFFEALNAINIKMTCEKDLSAGDIGKIRIKSLGSKESAIPGKKMKVDIRLSALNGNKTAEYEISVPVQVPENTELGNDNLKLSVANGYSTADIRKAEGMSFDETANYFNKLFRPGLFLTMRYSVKNEAEKNIQNRDIEFEYIDLDIAKKTKSVKSKTKIFTLPLPAAFDKKTNFFGEKEKSFNVIKEEPKIDEMSKKNEEDAKKKVKDKKDVKKKKNVKKNKKRPDDHDRSSE